MTVVSYIAFIAFPVGMAFAAASDLLTMAISNKLTLALLVAFLALAPFAGMDLTAVGLHFAAGGAVLAVAFFCFAMGWIGGGDAKLAAVAALWLGWDSTLSFIAVASVFGGILTLIVLSFRSAVLPAFIVRQPWVQRLHDEKAGVPYGVALAAAGLAVYPHTIWMRMALG
ncbi:MAG: prepilin peptidase [Bauldia sp.]|nr:prepilin peptidase [Bauldia sp.]